MVVDAVALAAGWLAGGWLAGGCLAGGWPAGGILSCEVDASKLHT